MRKAREKFGLKLHHIGIVTDDFDRGTRIYEALGYTVRTGTVDDPNQRAYIQVLALGDDPPLEVIVPASADCPVCSFLDKTRGGLHHMCFETKDFEGLLNYVAENGGLVLSRPVPAPAFHGRRTVFVFWDDTLTEFIEA